MSLTIDTVTEETTAAPKPPTPKPSGGSGGGRPRKRRPNRFANLPKPSQPAPRDTRWWFGIGILSVSLVILMFIVHVSVISQLQHARSQAAAYETLRETLALATAPVGPLVEDEPVAAGTPLGLLEIPAIGLQEVIVEGTGADTLRIGPGHRRDTAMPGQPGTSVLLGRQAAYGGPFGELYKLQPGDRINLTTGQGESTFTVFSIRRGGEPEPEPARPGESRLQLVTGDGPPFAPHGVLYVEATLDTPVLDPSARVIATSALPASERAMGTNTLAWGLAGVFILFFVQAAAGIVWAWHRWGKRPAWVVGVPVLLCLALLASDAVMNAMPNLL